MADRVGLVRRAGLVVSIAGLAMSSVLMQAQAQAQAQRAAGSVEVLRQGFLKPPMAARPMVRWWWFGPAVTKPEILHELQQMKADGMGGAELAFVYAEELDDPAREIKNLSFLSPEMLDAVKYAQAEGRRLGLRIDVTLCSGWPYGGPATTLEEAAGRLRVMEVELPSGEERLPVPKLMEGESIVAEFVAAGAPKQWQAGTARQVALPGGAANRAGSSPGEAGKGPRVGIFFIASHTKQQVKRAAVGAEGYVLDPFSKQAVATHLKAVGEPLVKAFGATPPYAIFSDSLEAYGADWTPALPEEFRKRRGYDLLPHLPELYAGGTPEADKVRHDYGKTLTELVNENYLVQINEWAHAHQTKFRSQTYGEPAVSLSSQRLVDLPEGEGPQWRAFSTLRWATSGNHVFGNNVTSGETFTWLHSPVFRATPLDMKAEADIDFIMGENQLIYHGWPYSAPKAEINPGWSLYAAAVFNDHNPWHPVMPAVSEYVARLSYMMRQGKPANQVAVLLPTDDAWAGFSPGKVTVTGAMQRLLPREMLGAILSAGYNFDFTDADAVERVGIQHPILVVPPTDRIPLATLRKIEAYVKAGGKVVAVGKLPSMDADGRPLPGEAMRGLPVVPGASELGQALHDASAADFRVSDVDADTRDRLGFIRRKLPGSDVYFVVNTGNLRVKAKLALATAHGAGEEWDVATGKASGVLADGIDLQLEAYESRLFVFGGGAVRGAKLPQRLKPQASYGTDGTAKAVPLTRQEPDVVADLVVADLGQDWTVTFTGTGKSAAQHELKDWAADPDTLHYSGEAVYSREFELKSVTAGPVWLEVEGGKAEPGAPNSPPEHGERDKYNMLPNGMPNPLVTRPGPGMRAFYDAPVKEAAMVIVNGHEAGALWHPPYRLDVSKLLKKGTNRIEIRVYNTAMNAWAALPPHDYKPLIAKYGDKFQMQDLGKVAPLPSGLVGRVRLVR